VVELKLPEGEILGKESTAVKEGGLLQLPPLHVTPLSIESTELVVKDFGPGKISKHDVAYTF